MDATKDYTFGGTGVIAGVGSFTKSGAGTLLVNNNNTFTGPLSVNGGLIQYNNNAYLGSGKITMNGGTLSFSLSGSGTYLTLANDLSISAGTTNTIIMSQRETLSGTVTGSGTLNLVAPSTLGGTRDYLSGSWSQFSGVLNLSGEAMLHCQVQGGAFDGLNNATVTISNETLGVDGTPGGETINLGALSGNSGASLAGSGYGYGGLVTWQVGGLNSSTTFAGAIQNGSLGSAAITKIGAGTLTLSGNSTHSGATIVSNGTLLVTGNISNSPATVANGGTLQGTGFLGGGVTIQSGGIISPGAGIGSVGTLTVGNGLSLTTATLYFDLSSSPSSGNDKILMSGGALTMSGTQTFQFNLLSGALGDGTYSLIEGATNNTASSVTLANNLPSGARQTFTMSRPSSGSSTGYVALVVSGSPAANLIWQGTNGSAWDAATTNWLNGPAADKFYNVDTVTFNDSSTNGTVSLAGTLQPASVLVTNNTLAYTLGGSGALIGSGALTKGGSGTLTISTTNNSYTGNIFVAGGALWAGVGANLGSGTLNLSGGGSFNLPSGESISLPIFISAGQSGTLYSGALGNSISGAISSGSSSSVLNLSGGCSFGGTSSSQFDNFTGTIVIPAGSTLRYAPNSSGNTYGSLNSTLVINGTLQPRNAGNTIQLGALSGSGTLSGPQSNAGTGDTLYVIGGNNASASFSGNISSNTAVAGSQIIVNKIGTGTLTLGGNSTYTGGTTVSAGTLLVTNRTGSATGTGDLEILLGATLAGNGIIGSATTVDDFATFAPGNPAGTLTFTSDLTLNDNSALQFALGTSSDSVAVGGDVFLTGKLSVTNAAGFAAGSYPLFTCAGTLTLDDLALVSAPSGYNYSFDTNTPGVVKLVVALPAPPVIGSPAVSGGKLVFSGTGGTPGATYYVVTATNLAAPAANWTRILTNQFDTGGNFAVTNPPATNVQSFYRLQLQ